MTRSVAPVLALAAALALGGCHHFDRHGMDRHGMDRQAMGGFSAADAAAVRQVAADWEATYNAGNKAGLRDLIEPGIVMHQPDMPAITGADAYVEFFSSPPELTSIDIVVNEVLGRGMLAYASGTFSGDVATPDGTVNVPGKWLVVFRKGAGGEWRLLRHTASPDVPM